VIPVRLVLLGISLAVDLIREVPRAVRRGRERRRAEVAPFCPACDDDPAERCGVCGRRRSWVEA
jgi:hypothetical protein